MQLHLREDEAAAFKLQLSEEKFANAALASPAPACCSLPLRSPQSLTTGTRFFFYIKEGTPGCLGAQAHVWLEWPK